MAVFSSVLLLPFGDVHCALNRAVYKGISTPALARAGVRSFAPADRPADGRSLGDPSKEFTQAASCSAVNSFSFSDSMSAGV